MAALVASLLSSPVARAQEPATLPDLGELVVVGKSGGVQAGGAVTTVTAEEIASRGARTLDQALQLLPGVVVRVGGEGVPRIDVRGFRTRHVLLLLDGIPLNSAVDQQFDPTLIPTENIERIKVTEGVSSVLLGQGGLGAVINIITRKARRPLAASVAAESGTQQPFLGRATVSGLVEPLDVFASASVSHQDDFPLAASFVPTAEQPGGLRLNSDRQRLSAFLGAGLAPRPDLSFRLTVNWSHGAYGQPGSVISDPFDVFATPPRYARVPSTDAFSAQLAADARVVPWLRLRAWSFASHLDEQADQYDDARLDSFQLRGSSRLANRATVLGVALRPQLDLGAAGALGLLLSVEHDWWTTSGTTTLGPGQQVAVDRASGYGVYSLGAEYEYAPVEAVNLAVGYAYHWQVRELEAGTRNGFVVLATAAYDPVEGTRLKASFQRNLRFPSLRDLFDPDRGNPRLAPERSMTFAAGLEQRLPLRTSLQLDGYYTFAEDLIQQDQVNGVQVNLADVRLAGCELGVTSRPLEGLVVKAAYGFLHSEDRSRPGREEQQYTPRDKVTLQAGYAFPFGLEARASLLYLGNQYFYSKNSVATVSKARLADLFLVDLRVSQKLLQDRLSLYLGVTNLLDLDFESAYGFPQPGRRLQGGIELSL